MILKILHSCRKNFSCKDFHFDSKGIGIPPLLNNFNSSIRLKKISQTSAISFTTPSAYKTVKRGQLFFLSTPSACKNFQSSTISFQEKYPTFTRMYSIGFRVENVWPAIWSRFYSSRNIGRNAADRSAKQNEMIAKHLGGRAYFVHLLGCAKK